MANSVTVRKIGNSQGVILPKADLERLGVSEGDKLFVIYGPDGIRLVPYDPDFAKAIETARDFMHRYRDAMRELAR